MKDSRLLWGCAWLLVLGLALGLRSIDLDFGLPQRLHPDEWSQVEVAWRMSGGDWNPHFFRYPAGTMTLLAVIYWLGAFFHRPDLSELYLSARWVSVLFGTLTVALAGWWAWRLWRSRWVALSVGLLSALTWTWIEQSHYAIVDVPLLFWSGLALFALSEVSQAKKWLIVSAVALGFAVASKYTALLLVIPFLLTIWLEFPPALSLSPSTKRWIAGCSVVLGLSAICMFAGTKIWMDEILSWAARLTSDGHLEAEYLQLYDQLAAMIGLAGISLLLLAGALVHWPTWSGWSSVFQARPYVLLFLSFAVFAILSPFTLIEWRQSTQDFFYEYRHMQIGSAAQYVEGSLQLVVQKDWSVLPSLPAYLNLLHAEWGLPALLLAGLGSITLVRLRPGFGTALLVYVILQFLIITRWANYATRYALTLYLPMVVLVGGGLLICVQWLQKGPARWAMAGALLMFILVLWTPARSTLSGLTVFRLPDTRQAAYDWALANIPAGATVAYDSYAPDFQAEPYPNRLWRTSSYILDEYLPEELQELDIDFVFTTLDPNGDHVTSSVAPGNWLAFNTGYRLVKSFISEPGYLRGRSIWVYEARRLQ